MATRFGRAGGAWNTSGTWSASSGGASDGAGINAGDDVVLDSNSSGTFTISASISINTIICTGFTGTLVHSTGVTLTISGNTATFSSGMTYTFTGAGRVIAFTSTTGTTTLTSGGRILPGILVNGVGGTVQLQDSLTFGAAGADAITLTNGTFDANGFNVTGSQFSSNNSNTRVLSMGTGTWTINSTGGTAFDVTGTGITVNAGSSTLNFSSSLTTTNRTIQFGTAHTFGTVGITNTASNPWSTTFGGTTSATIGTLNLTGPVQVIFNASITFTVTNAINWAGTSSNPLLILGGASFTPTVSLTGGGTIAWAMIGGITFTGSAATTSNSLALPGNSGITVNVPSGGGGSSIGSFIGN